MLSSLIFFPFFALKSYAVTFFKLMQKNCIIFFQPQFKISNKAEKYISWKTKKQQEQKKHLICPMI